MPAALVPVAGLKAAFLAGNALLLAVLVHLSARLARLTPRLPALWAATALALWLEPVFQTLLFGQINLALACLVLAGLTRPSGARWKGAAVGVAAGIKLTPALFIAYLLLRGRHREAGTAAAAFAGTGRARRPRAPLREPRFRTRRLYETERRCSSRRSAGRTTGCGASR